MEQGGNFVAIVYCRSVKRFHSYNPHGAYAGGSYMNKPFRTRTIGTLKESPERTKF